MYLNTFAPGLEPIDMTTTDEFESLLASAKELGVEAHLPVRYISRNVVANGLRFHCLEWGDPSSPPALLLHGGNQSSHSWDLVALSLADRYHIIAPDQRGHGDSEWPRDGETSPSSMAEDAVQFIKLFDLRKPLIMGHSMGGMVTMKVLSSNPGIARRAVIVDVGPELAPQGSQTIGRFVSSMDEISTVEEYVERVSKYDPFRPKEHIHRTLRYNMMHRVDGKLVPKRDQRRLERQPGSTVMTDRPGYEDVARIDCPTLIVRGQHSNVLMPDAAERFRDALSNGKLVEVADCGHNVHSQNTIGFLEAVVPFIDED